jgi:uncharacterized repeat protein (TIGR03803 family)
MRNMIASHRLSVLQPSGWVAFFVVTLAVAATMLVSAGAASAQSHLDVLHPFTGKVGYPLDGTYPQAALIQATDGSFYGTTPGYLNADGTDVRGTVFMLTAPPSYTYTVLYVFRFALGPAAPLIQATDGNFYGTTVDGGSSNAGVIFMITPTPDHTITFLHEFTGGTTDGANPGAALIQATDGNFYGTSQGGGSFGSGTVFKMTSTSDHTVTILHAFMGGSADGANPSAALVQGTDGNFYGTTDGGGGPFNSGTIFKMTPSSIVTTLRAFTGGTTDGADPEAALIQATDGNFYGTTYWGGPSNAGTVFKMTPTPDHIVTFLHVFTGGADGAHPFTSLIEASDGYFYGTASSGGASYDSGTVFPDDGTIFKMTPSGTVSVLHSFTGGADGAAPYAPLIQVTDGSFYGTAAAGGASGEGVVFRLTPPEPVGDFDGDGRSDITVYRPSSGTSWVLRSSTSYSTWGSYVWGEAGDIPAQGDFDGDGKADVVMYRPSNGGWYILQSSTGYKTYVIYQWGIPGDLPVPGDYDGDGKTDPAVYRPSNDTWYILQSSTGYTTAVSYDWGAPGDIPVTGDYDGDGRTDIAMYRPSNGGWYILLSSLNYDLPDVSYVWGGEAGDVPVQADYDGDGKTDIAVYRPSNGGWYLRLSSQNYTPYVSYQWGLTGDIPVLGDFDGDRKADIAVYRPSSGDWFILWSSTNYSISASSAYQWGLAGDVPLLKRP